MEILIVVSAGIAVGALIAYLRNSYRDLREKDRLLEIAESRLAALSGEVGNESTVSPMSGSERIADLERQVADLTRERSELRGQLERNDERQISSLEQSRDAESLTSRRSQRVAELESENSALRSRVAELEAERGGDQKRIVLLQDEHGKLFELEERVARLQEERSELAERLRKAESEKEAGSQRILHLEGLKTRLPELEAQVANLRGQNAQLLQQRSELQASMREQVKNQLEALQELYQKLDSNLL